MDLESQLVNQVFEKIMRKIIKYQNNVNFHAVCDHLRPFFNTPILKHRTHDNRNFERSLE